MSEKKRSVPGARLARQLVGNGASPAESIKRLGTLMKRAKQATEGISFDRQLVHNIGLTIIGAIVLYSYEYLATHLGLSHAPDVFLAAGFSGSGGVKQKKFRHGGFTDADAKRMEELGKRLK